WDERRRTQIAPTGKLVTTTYLSPGYYNAKLVADGQIIKSQPVYIPSNGFEVYAYEEGAEDFHPLPFSFWQLQDGSFSYRKEFSAYRKEHSVAQQQIVNLLPLPTVSPDSFTFHTQFLMPSPQNGDLCHGLGVSLAAEKEAYFFRLGKLGCSGRFTIFLGQEEISGSTNDLSTMGFATDSWIDLKITKRGQQLSLRLNDKVMLVTKEAPDFGAFGGVRLFSQEPLSLRTLSFQDKNGSIDLLHKE
ncbi:MAG: hypothetical protein AAGA62_15560, partial [Bacteroidota bacterium]